MHSLASTKSQMSHVTKAFKYFLTLSYSVFLLVVLHTCCSCFDAGVASFIQVSKGAWAMLNALFKVTSSHGTPDLAGHMQHSFAQ